MLSPADISIQHFCTFPHGGAANAAMRLHDGLRKYDVGSKFVYHRDDHQEIRPKANAMRELPFDVNTKPTAANGRSLNWLSGYFSQRREKEIHRLHQAHIANRPKEFETFAMARLPYATRLNEPRLKNELLHLHWVSFFLDYPSFFASVPDETPIVWTLHDMHAFTGGCHFSGTCTKFKTGCGGCPQLQNPNPKDVSRDSFLAKQKALQGKTIHVIAPSEWLLSLAKSSDVWPAKTQFHKIHYGVDLNDFRPLDQATARQQLGLPANKKLIAFGAADVSNPRKGFQYLTEALQKVQQACPDQFECLVFGGGETSLSESPMPCHSLGFLRQPERLRRVYSAADVVVIPSLEDNQPQVGLESMACGTPVIGFNAGGIPEYVQPEKTGLLATEADASSLATQIIRLTHDDELHQTASAAARRLMEREFETETQAWQHLVLYRKILEAAEHATVKKKRGIRRAA